MKKISVIVPVYNEEEVIDDFYNKIKEVEELLKHSKFELIFVDDGSNDSSLDKIKKFKNVKYISFSRNFGKESAMYAGLKNATGDYAVVIDADLQHNPLLIIEMEDILENEDYDSVVVRRVNNNGKNSKLSKLFYKVFSKLTHLNLKSGETDYRMMNKCMYESVLSLCENNRFSKGIFSWVGFKTKVIEQRNIERTKGISKWSFSMLLNYAAGGIISFTTKPLKVAYILGIIFSLFSFIALIITLIITEEIITLALILWVIILLSGINLMCIGLIGSYLSKVYIEAKKRPLYIVRESNIKR